jgi:hypothetical protein
MMTNHLRRVGWILSGLAAGLTFVVAVRFFASPLRFVPAGRVWVFVSPDCPYSVDVHRQIRDTDENSASRTLVVVPADIGPAAFPRSLEICATTFEQIGWTQRAIGRLLPEPIACRWLIEDASAIHSQLAVHWPAWYDGERIIRDDVEIEKLLAARGLTFDAETNTLLLAGQAVPEARRRVPTPSSDDGESVWDDLSEPHIIGW